MGQVVTGRKGRTVPTSYIGFASKVLHDGSFVSRWPTGSAQATVPVGFIFEGLQLEITFPTAMSLHSRHGNIREPRNLFRFRNPNLGLGCGHIYHRPKQELFKDNSREYRK